MREYHVFILASHSRTLYIGMTNDIRRRISEHKRGAIPGFTMDYRITNLVYFETSAAPRTAIAREKQLKRWPRWRKIRLIEADNPAWRDLSADWLGNDLASEATKAGRAGLDTRAAVGGAPAG